MSESPRFADRSFLPAMVLALAAVVGITGASAQAPKPTQSQSVPTPGFSTNRNDPINIESDSLELRDKEKTATFTNNVRLVQGDTTLECKVLIVHYDDETPAPAAGKGAAAPRAGAPQTGQQQIKKLEAKGGVVITQKDQVATGDSGVFDAKSNTMILTGNVVLTQGQNVVKGDRLFVDLNTNVSRVESRKSSDGRVQGLFLPSSRDQIRQQGAKPGGDDKPSTGSVGAGSHGTAEPPRTQDARPEREAAKPAPARPMRLN